MNLSQSFKAWYSSTPVLRFLFSILRNIKPVAVFGKTVWVTRYKDVVEVLARQDDFTVYQIDGYKMVAMGNNFVLGMDASPEATRDRDILRQVIKREDLDFIRGFIRKKGAGLIEEASSAWHVSQKGGLSKLEQPSRVCAIDVVNGYARVAAVRLVAGYFGVPANEKKMMEWQRAIFDEAFVNLSNDPAILEKGREAATEAKTHVAELIKEKKRHPGSLGDTVLDRLILKQKDNAWLDDEAVGRNIMCILGVVENTSKVVTHVIDQLLRRPAIFEKARAAAMAGDIDSMRKYSFEALRFNPHNPAILRFCKSGSVLGKGTPREKKIPAGATVYAATLSAMFDPEVVSKPREFDPERKVDYLHFGHGPHICAGRYISEVTVPELVAGLLRLKNLRRAKGRAGQIEYDQIVFPNRLMLEFEC
jgi:cytochrome P450